MTCNENVSFLLLNFEMQKAEYGNWVPSEGITALVEVIHRAQERRNIWLIVNPGQHFRYTEKFSHSSEFSGEFIDRLRLIGISIKEDSVTITI